MSDRAFGRQNLPARPVRQFSDIDERALAIGIRNIDEQQRLLQGGLSAAGAAYQRMQQQNRARELALAEVGLLKQRTEALSSLQMRFAEFLPQEYARPDWTVDSVLGGMDRIQREVRGLLQYPQTDDADIQVLYARDQAAVESGMTRILGPAVEDLYHQNFQRTQQQAQASVYTAVQGLVDVGDHAGVMSTYQDAVQAGVLPPSVMAPGGAAEDAANQARVNVAVTAALTIYGEQDEQAVQDYFAQDEDFLGLPVRLQNEAIATVGRRITADISRQQDEDRIARANFYGEEIAGWENDDRLAPGATDLYRRALEAGHDPKEALDFVMRYAEAEDYDDDLRRQIQDETEGQLHSAMMDFDLHAADNARDAREHILREGALGHLRQSQVNRWVDEGGILDRKIERRLKEYEWVETSVNNLFDEGLAIWGEDALRSEDGVLRSRKMSGLKAIALDEFYRITTEGIEVTDKDGTRKMMVPTPGGAEEYMIRFVDDLLVPYDNRGWLRKDRPRYFQEMLEAREGEYQPPDFYPQRPITSPLRTGRGIVEYLAPAKIGDWENFVTPAEQAGFAVAQIPLQHLDPTASLSEQEATIAANESIMQRLIAHSYVRNYWIDRRSGALAVQLVANGDYYLRVPPSTSLPKLIEGLEAADRAYDEALRQIEQVEHMQDEGWAVEAPLPGTDESVSLPGRAARTALKVGRDALVWLEGRWQEIADVVFPPRSEARLGQALTIELTEDGQMREIVSGVERMVEDLRDEPPPLGIDRMIEMVQGITHETGPEVRAEEWDRTQREIASWDLPGATIRLLGAGIDAVRRFSGPRGQAIRETVQGLLSKIRSRTGLSSDDLERLHAELETLNE